MIIPRRDKSRLCNPRANTCSKPPTTLIPTFTCSQKFLGYVLTIASTFAIGKMYKKDVDLRFSSLSGTYLSKV